MTVWQRYSLAQCLEASDDPVQREGLLQALFHVYRWDVEPGGYGIGDDVPDRILELANLEERRKVAEWVQSALPEGDSRSDNYHRQIHGAFLLALLETELDDECFLQISRETGRLHDAVAMLRAIDCKASLPGGSY